MAQARHRLCPRSVGDDEERTATPNARRPNPTWAELYLEAVLANYASFRGRDQFLIPAEYAPKPASKRSLEEIITECRLERDKWQEVREAALEELDDDDD